MTIAILRRLLQILLFLAALGLVLALPRALAGGELLAGGETATLSTATRHGGAHPPVDSAPLRLTPRAWRSASLALGATSILLVPATLTALVLGLVLGAWCGRARTQVVRSGVAVASAVALAIPVFLVARVAVMAVAPLPDAALALLAGEGGFGAFRALATSAAALACIAIMVAAIVPGVLDAARTRLRLASSASWMKFARAQGISRRRIATVFVRPVLLVATATLAPRAIALLLGVACVVENVFGWPGIGHLLVASIVAGDAALASACLSLFAAVLGVIALGGAALRRVFDPRRATRA